MAQLSVSLSSNVLLPETVSALTEDAQRTADSRLTGLQASLAHQDAQEQTIKPYDSIYIKAYMVQAAALAVRLGNPKRMRHTGAV